MRPDGFLLRLGQGRQNDGSQDGDNGDDNEQLDQREGGRRRVFSTGKIEVGFCIHSCAFDVSKFFARRSGTAAV